MAGESRNFRGPLKRGKSINLEILHSRFKISMCNSYRKTIIQLDDICVRIYHKDCSFRTWCANPEWKHPPLAHLRPRHGGREYHFGYRHPCSLPDGFSSPLPHFTRWESRTPDSTRSPQISAEWISSSTFTLYELGYLPNSLVSIIYFMNLLSLSVEWLNAYFFINLIYSYVTPRIQERSGATMILSIASSWPAMNMHNSIRWQWPHTLAFNSIPKLLWTCSGLDSIVRTGLALLIDAAIIVHPPVSLSERNRKRERGKTKIEKTLCTHIWLIRKRTKGSPGVW